MKIYVATMEAFREKERHGEIQFITNIDGFMSFTSPPPLLNANFLFRFLKKKPYL
jgi:hypothetical protein